MKKQIFRNRKARHASITVILTVLVIAVTVLANAVVGKLANRFNWYTYMPAEPNYAVTESCYALLENAFTRFSRDGIETKTEIIFCDTQEKLDEDGAMVYIYETALALSERFPEHITVRFYDVVANPTTVSRFATAIDPDTGEEADVAIPSTSVIITNGGDYHRIYAREDFYLLRTGESTFWAYDGERHMAAGILHALDPQRPVACLLSNHGETYYDYELLYVLDDAGYSIEMLDLYEQPIPENCNLLISYNPTGDLTADSIAATSEIDILESFLSKGGNHFLTFIGNNSPALPNYEAFLEKWGVDFSYRTTSEGKSFRYMVNDEANSLTSDGYTIYGEVAEEGNAAAMLESLSKPAIFKNATAMDNAASFVHNGDGSYTNGNRTMYALYTGNETAVNWADGSPIASADDAILMSLTQQTNADGLSSVAVIAATDFAGETFMQSPVYGNTDLMFRMFELFGKNHTPRGLAAKPMETTGISILTTREMVIWTVALAVTPMVVTAVLAVAVLAKRRRA